MARLSSRSSRPSAFMRSRSPGEVGEAQAPVLSVSGRRTHLRSVSGAMNLPAIDVIAAKRELYPRSLREQKTNSALPDFLGDTSLIYPILPRVRPPRRPRRFMRSREPVASDLESATSRHFFRIPLHRRRTATPRAVTSAHKSCGASQVGSGQ